MMNLGHYAEVLLIKIGLHDRFKFWLPQYFHCTYLRNFIFFPIAGYLRTKGIGYKEDQYIGTLKNSQEGGKCFVIATSPSLTLEDVNKVTGVKCFGVNSIFRLYEKTKWRPDYYVLMDPSLFETFYKEGFLSLDEFGKEICFVNSLNRKHARSKKRCIVHTNWLDHIYNYGSTLFKHHEDPRFGIYDYYSVTHLTILLAMHMGFKEIYLLGVDNNFVGNKLHFVDTKGDEPNLNYDQGVKIQNAMDNGYKAIKELAEKHSVKIFNATRGGRLEVFPRLSLEEAICNGRK